jgi:hypothetical protein
MFVDVQDLLEYYSQMRLSEHALREVHKESLRAKDVFHAVFNGTIVEDYPERQRLLIVGPCRRPEVQLHVVCEYTEGDEIVAVTVYIPDRPKWINEVVRGH